MSEEKNGGHLVIRYKLAKGEGEKVQYLLDATRNMWNMLVAKDRQYSDLYRKLKKEGKLDEIPDRPKLNAKYIREKREENPEWYAVTSDVVDGLAFKFEKGLKTYFGLKKNASNRNPQRPSFKHRDQWQSFGGRNRNTHKWVKGRYFVLPAAQSSTGPREQYAPNVALKFHKHAELPGKPASWLLKKTKSGVWYLYLSCVVQEARPHKEETGKIVGIDFGLSTFITTSDGEKIDGYKELDKHIKAKVKAQKQMSRRHKRGAKDQSNGYKSAREAKNKAEIAIEEARNIMHRSLADRLTSKYDIICIEDIDLRGMKKLWGKKVSTIAWGKFRMVLEQTCKRDGKQFVKIGKYFPSTKVCNSCGHHVEEDFFKKIALKSKKLPQDGVSLEQVEKLAALSVRKWDCPNCGTHHDRDINAAKNILAEGLRILAGGTAKEGSSHKTEERTGACTAGTSHEC